MEGFDLESYFEHVGDSVPEDPADVFRREAAPAVESNSRYYVWWRKSQTQASHPAYLATWGILNVWNPAIASGDHSLVQAAVLRGSGSGLQTVEAGLRRTNGAIKIFIFFTTDNYVTFDHWRGGYNADFDGWVQQSGTIFPGSGAAVTSVYNGTQYGIDVAIEHLPPGKWKVWVNGEYMGYYARCWYDNCDGVNPYVFSSSGLRNRAGVVNWQGEVFDAAAPHSTTTDMGSGYPASQGFGKAAYISNIQARREGANYMPFQNVAAAESVYATDSSCYSVDGPFGSNGGWINSLYYGGTGKNVPGNPTKCNY